MFLKFGTMCIVFLNPFHVTWVKISFCDMIPLKWCHKCNSTLLYLWIVKCNILLFAFWYALLLGTLRVIGTLWQLICILTWVISSVHRTLSWIIHVYEEFNLQDSQLHFPFQILKELLENLPKAFKLWTTNCLSYRDMMKDSSIWQKAHVC